MIKIENFEVVGWEYAIRGMRNPMNSWNTSDTCFGDVFCGNCDECLPGKCGCGKARGLNGTVGTADLDLMLKLRNAGTDHRKFMRMIAVYLDITAPLYWWKEFDTYKVGTVANSCSTMHKIAAKEFVPDDFSHEHLLQDWLNEENIDAFTPVPEYDDDIKYWSPMDILKVTIDALNVNRKAYLAAETALKTKTDLTLAEKKHLMAQQKLFWWQMIQLLPSSYNQKRTIMLNYEVLANIYKSRHDHKLDEWVTFCDWIEKLPYSEIIIGEKGGASDV